jgi:hypothetical protein
VIPDAEVATEASAVTRFLISRGPMAPVPTLEQFNQVAEISKMAAANKMTGLSLRAIREALKASPPLVPQAADKAQAAMSGMVGATVARTTTGNRVTSSTTSAGGGPTRVQDYQPANSQQVDWKLSKLVQTWNGAGVPVVDQYETLAAVVFPEGRPTEICIYPRSMAAQARPGSESVARLLVNAAVQASRIDDLK